MLHRESLLRCAPVRVVTDTMLFISRELGSKECANGMIGELQTGLIGEPREAAEDHHCG